MESCLLFGVSTFILSLLDIFILSQISHDSEHLPAVVNILF